MLYWIGLIGHLTLPGVFVSAFEEGFCSGKNSNPGLHQSKFCVYFFLLKGDADGDKPLEIHASNEERAKK